tara:strand:- start:1087 stop:1581 length:495 start_codon:yes stop_codon:yes gene_type:complete
MDPDLIYELIMDYNNNPQRYNDEEAETIATLANSMGKPFERESKALSKGLFDLVDTASFGLVPDDWRPVSRGQSVYGETGMEKLLGGLGTGAGIIGGGIGAFKGARGLMRSKPVRSAADKAYGAGRSAALTADDMILGGRGRNALDRVRRQLDFSGIGNVGINI